MNLMNGRIFFLLGLDSRRLRIWTNAESSGNRDKRIFSTGCAGEFTISDMGL